MGRKLNKALNYFLKNERLKKKYRGEQKNDYNGLYKDKIQSAKGNRKTDNTIDAKSRFL